MNNTEGDRCSGIAGRMPGASICILHRGLRPTHVHKGRPGTWEISLPPARAGTIERSDKPSDVGEREVGVPQYER